MNKAELIDVLTDKLGTDRRTATAAVEHVVDTIVRAVHKGQSVTITGFGVFEPKKRAARVARNPRTGETVKVKPTLIPAFRPGAQFKAVIAGKQKLSATGPAVKRGANPPVSTKRTPATKTTAKGTRKTAKKATAGASKAAAKAPAKKTTARKTTAKKVVTPAKKTAAKKTTATKKATATKKTATKAPAKKAPAKKASAARKTSAAKKTTARKTAKKTTSRRR